MSQRNKNGTRAVTPHKGTEEKQRPPSLDSKNQKLILSLNADLPEGFAATWVTVEEMQRRLVVGGVDKVLSVELLQRAIERVNRSETILSRRKEGRSNTAYYRPSIFMHDTGTPEE